jgi:RNA polymerase sigma-70 factor (ECF subfamily)
LAGRADAEDLAQQTLLKIFFRISEFNTSRDGVAWAFGIAIYEVRTLRRKRQRRREIAADAVGRIADRRPSPEAVLIETDLRRALAESLGELSDADRAVLLPEGPVEITVSAAAWRKRRQRALARLRSVWRNRDA